MAVAAGLSALAAGPALGQSGQEQTQKLVKSVDSTVKSIGDTRQQLEKTVAGYNAIMEQTAKDPKDAYKDLGKDITESEKKVGDARLKVDEMNAEAQRHFTAWKANAAAITAPELREKMEKRLGDAPAGPDNTTPTPHPPEQQQELSDPRPRRGVFFPEFRGCRQGCGPELRHADEGSQ